MKAKLVSDQNRRVHINMDAVNAYTGRWKPGTPFSFEIVRRIKRASCPQRGFYFGVILPAFLEAYYYEPEDAATCHDHLKALFFHVQPDKHGIYRSKDLPSVFSDDPTVTQEQRKQFMDWVIRKAAQSPDNPIMVPEPGEPK